MWSRQNLSANMHLQKLLDECDNELGLLDLGAAPVSLGASGASFDVVGTAGAAAAIDVPDEVNSGACLGLGSSIDLFSFEGRDFGPEENSEVELVDPRVVAR